MNESIFSTYSTGENRVTASILAVLRCLALPRIERILGALMEDADFQLVRFENQPARGGKGTPDGEIGSSCRLLLETKLVRNDLHRDQLERHLDRLNATSEKDRLVLVLTPDNVQPDLITAMKSERPIWNDLLIWNNFAALNQAIDELLAFENTEKEVVSEREEFLLRELQKMLLAEKDLIGSSKDVLIIPARHAWPLYKEDEIHAYICQAGRAFRPVKHIGFYERNLIHPLVPLILEQHDQVIFERGKHSGRLGLLVDQALSKSERPYWPYKWTVHKVFLLSAPDVSETVKLHQPVINDMVSASGQRTAFTQNQRYVSLGTLQKAKKTSELED